MPIPRSAGAFFKNGTISNTALSLIAFGFTAAQVQASSRAFIALESGSIRVTWDTAQTAPTTTTGILIKIQDYPIWELVGMTNLANLQMIRDGSVDVTANIMLETD